MMPIGVSLGGEKKGLSEEFAVLLVVFWDLAYVD
jgi:hypothetical protein